MTIAVTGAKGRLGSHLVREGCVALDCDIADRDQVRDAIDSIRPRVIINCASWTAVDDAENDKNEDAVLRSNLRGPSVLRREFTGYMIHISTGFVFDGKAGPYSEDAEPCPINFYGWTKLGGEAAVLISQPTLIIRTLDLFGPDTKTDFVRQIRDVLELAQPYQLPTNLYGSPTYIPHLAEAVLALEKMGRAGLINVAGDKTLSRYTWGKMIADAFGHDPDLIEPTEEIKGIAPRPLRGGLLVDKAKSLGVPIYGPEEGLEELAGSDEPD